jgi:hypothetical protein
VYEGVSATALLDRLIVEGVEQLDHPGIVFRGPAHDRRAALAAGPDVWEVTARLREIGGSEEQRAALDAAVVAAARTEARAMVTENVADFATERDMVLVFVLKRKLPAGSTQAAALAKALDAWAAADPDPYLGPHWPSIR